MLCNVAIRKVVGMNSVLLARQLYHGIVLFPKEAALAWLQ